MRLISIALITLFLTASTVSADSARESRGGGGLSHVSRQIDGLSRIRLERRRHHQQE